MLAGDRDEIARALARAVDEPPARRLASHPTERSPSREEHEARVRRAKEHIRAGDAFQIVLSQRAVRRTDASAVELYRALRRINPSPYLFLLELGDVALVGSSPETHVKLEGERASLNPIAGTIASGEGDAEQLLASEKDRAEHVMLVDLGRNDLSRVCRPGTVRVERFLEAERYSHVTHLVSEVAGEILPGHSAFDLLRATFPAGTVSGAPKIRAMQIISELEGYGRGIVRRRRRLCAAERRPRHVHRHPNARAARRRRLPPGRRRYRRRLRPGRGAPGVPEQARGARGGDRRGGARMILLVDNYDSFTYNLAHLLQELGADVLVRRNDAIDADEAERLSRRTSSSLPGPDARPSRARRSSIVRRLARTTPTLGVCLGHQAIVEAFGGEIGQATAAPPRQDEPDPPRRQGDLHRACRRTSRPAATTRSRLRACPAALEISATSDDGEVMAVRHRELPVDGVQFHPESVLTLPLGRDLLQNFLEGRR